MKARTRDIRDLRTGYWSLREPLEMALELLFPYKCPVCGEPIPFETRLMGRGGTGQGGIDLGINGRLESYICPQCAAELNRITAPFCLKCGKELFDSNEEGLCSDCLRRERSFISCRSLFNYDEAMKSIMIALKYKGRREYAYMLGMMAAAELGSWIKEKGIDLIVPVPVHADRLKTRGYNQAELIAAEIASELGILMEPHALIRLKSTAPQKGLGAEMRLMNITNAFKADGERLGRAYKEIEALDFTDQVDRHSDCYGYLQNMRTSGDVRYKGSLSDNAGYKEAVSDDVRYKGSVSDIGLGYKRRNLTVLIVDDIYTTGSTMEACTLALKDVGIERIYALAIAAGADT